MTRWIGTWQLDPEVSQYAPDIARPARPATVISIDGDARIVRIRTECGAVESRKVVEIEIPTDGTLTPLSQPGYDGVRAEVSDGRQLETVVFASGRAVSRAMRRVSEDGRLMSVAQSVSEGDGQWLLASVELFRRVDTEPR